VRQELHVTCNVGERQLLGGLYVLARNKER
jgi:hypothetical protein